MISENTIQQVYEQADIVEVIGEFVTLTKSGSNWKGSSPFVEEKTPSFMVSPSKQIYKCFSSGQGGKVVTFLQDHKQMSFPEAIKYLAAKYNITVEETGKKQTPEEKDHVTSLFETARAAAKIYTDYLLNEDSPGKEYATTRGLSKDDILQWSLGYAPNSDRFITDKVVPKGYFAYAKELLLCGNKGGKNYDIFRNRIIFPIHNHQGQIVAFGGRIIGDGQPKYLNSSDSKIYHKSAVLYGLHFAFKAIQREGIAYLTEGYTDVISMYKAGVENTVATCGTALTTLHAKLLKRYCKRVVLLYDGDKPGKAAVAKALPILLKAGFKVEVCFLPDNQDPDDVVRMFNQEEVEVV